jgi:MEDS: MEthanogen/methylotroph, DcmR Sensory domain
VLTEAGLDVAGLEKSGRLAIVELDFDVPAQGSTDRWRRELDDALARGCTGLWYARFPVNPGDPGYQAVLGYEEEWHRTFRERPVVTICPFIVGTLDEPRAADALAAVSESHTGVLVSEPDDGFSRIRTR